MALADLLRRQDGLVSRHQALRYGMSLQAVRRRVRAGTWAEMLPGVLLADGHPFTHRSRVRAAWLWAGPGTFVDGAAAAFWHELTDRAPPVIGITVPPGTRRTPPFGIRLRRRTLPTADRASRNGVAVTGRPLTVLEAAPVVPDGITFLDRALQRSVTFDDMQAAYRRNLGAHGLPRAYALLMSAADGADSDIERLLVAGLRRAGTEGFVQGMPFGEWQIDIAFPAVRLAVEVDSWAWHTDPVRFARDRRKGNAIVLAGWRLLRFTWRDVTEHVDRCVDQIRAELARAA